MFMALNDFRFNLLLWNANSIHDKIDELYHLMTNNHIHIAAICETFLKPHHKLQTHTDFIVHRADRSEGRGGGVAIIINKYISHKLLTHINTKLIENISVEVFDEKNNSFIISSIYLPGGTSHQLIKQHYVQDLKKLMKFHKPYYLCGDINSRHREWNCFSANQAGKLLYNEYCINNFQIKYPDEFTYHPSSKKGNPSTIDLVITNGLHKISEFKCTPLSSDHLGVSFTIFTEDKFKSMPDEFSYNYQMADWDRYRKIIHHHSRYLPSTTDDIHTTNDVDVLINDFTELIKSARKKSIPTKTKSKQNLILTEETLQLIKVKNTLRKKWQLTRDPFYKSLINHYEREIKSQIKNLKNEMFQMKLSNIKPSHQAVWQIAKDIKNNNSIPPLKSDNKLLITPLEKAEALGEVFYKNHCNPLINDNLPFTNYVNSLVNMQVLDIESNVDLADDDEIISYIKVLKNKKAPGIDLLSNNLIKRLPSRGIKIIRVIINSCLKLGYFPQYWKIAKVIPIHKHGKRKDDVNSYRPISLLCSLSKLLERVILNRINRHLNENEILPVEQHGFRVNHSTVLQLHKLIKMAKENLSTKKSTGMVLMDVEKAFDRVWHNGLIFKLTSLLFPPYIINLIKQFLCDRKFYVNVKENKSKIFTIPSGVPQGAVLSPTLYNIFTYDIPKCTLTNMHLFADDIAFNTSHKNVNPITKALSAHALLIEEYTDKWKIKINGNKTQAIYITNRRIKQIPKKEIKIFHSKVKWVDESKYLGCVIDKKLNFSKHIDYVISRINTAISTLNPLLNQKSNLCVENKLQLYKLAIRPIMTYATPAFHDYLADVHKKKLQVIQNKSLKLIFGLDRRARTMELHRMANVPTVEEFIFKLSSNFIKKHNIL